MVYLNRPVQDGDVHLSAPFIYADALEELKPKPGMSFLNIVSQPLKKHSRQWLAGDKWLLPRFSAAHPPAQQRCASRHMIYRVGHACLLCVPACPSAFNSSSTVCLETATPFPPVRSGGVAASCSVPGAPFLSRPTTKNFTQIMFFFLQELLYMHAHARVPSSWLNQVFFTLSSPRVRDRVG